MGRQNVPRDQWLSIGVECPHCGERVYERDVYSWRPDRDDPKLLLGCRARRARASVARRLVRGTPNRIRTGDLHLERVAS